MEFTLKAHRVNRGLTIEEASKLIMVNPNTLSRWENKNTVPKKVYIPLIAKAYGIQEKDLIFLKNNPNKQ